MSILHHQHAPIFCVLAIFFLLNFFPACARPQEPACKQLQDVWFHGKRYMQFMFDDSNPNCTTGYLEPYDDASLGVFITNFQPISPGQSITARQQEFAQAHQKSIASMKQRALQGSPVLQRQNVDMLYCQGRISSEQAIEYYQQIEHARLLPQVQKAAQQARKKDKKNKKKFTATPAQKIAVPQSVSVVPERIQQPQVVQKSNIAALQIAQMHERNHDAKTLIDKNNTSFHQILDARAQALQKSLDPSLVTIQQTQIKAQTLGFLQAQGIATLPFEQVQGLPIQHQLTHELIDVVDQLAVHMQKYPDQVVQTDLAKYCVQLAGLTQQANQEQAISVALEGTNCCHGLQQYLQGLAMSDFEQAQQLFTNAYDYFGAVLNTYGKVIAKNVVQGAVAAYGFEALVAAGMVMAPVATTAAVATMIGMTAYVMAPVCMQAVMNVRSFNQALIAGKWDVVDQSLHDFTKWISSEETVGHIAGFVSAGGVKTPQLHAAVNNILSLRPVVTKVTNEAGQVMSRLHLMSQDRVKQVYQQSVELLQSPEFTNFNAMYKKFAGCHFFDLFPKSHSALAGIETQFMNAGEQQVVTQYFTQAADGIVEQVIKNEVAQAIPTVSNLTSKNIAMPLQDVIQQEMAKELASVVKNAVQDLYTPITAGRAVELADLSKNIRQLQDLAKHTNDFKNLSELIPADIAYLNRVYDLQPYRAQIKNFLDTHKPHFVHEGQIYFIEDIASYHIHAGEYFRKAAPKGGHSNYGGNKLVYFQPTLNKKGLLGAQDVIFYNSRFPSEIKKSSIYPADWSEYICDLKAIEVMMDKQSIIKMSADSKYLNITGFTSDGIEVQIGYDIVNKRIKTHFPLI